MRTRLSPAGVFAGPLLNALPVWPHHAFAAEFDPKRPVKLRGKVTNWMIEAGTPNTRFRRGFTKDSLKIGTEVLVDCCQAKDRSNTANGQDVTLPDGRKLFIGSQGTGAPEDEKR